MTVNRLTVLAILLLTSIIVTIPSISYAHPGRTDARGGHTCRTNCAKWGVPSNQWHSHGGSSSGSSSSSRSGSTATPSKPKTVTPPKPKVETKTETKTEKIAFETKYEDDSSLKKGKTTVKQEGEDGVITTTYEVTYTDGKETDRKKTGEEVTTKPVDKIVLEGTKVEKKKVKKKEVKESQEEDISDAAVATILLVLCGGAFAMVGLAGFGVYWFTKKKKKTSGK